MTIKHDETARKLLRRLMPQLPEAQFALDKEGPRLRVSSGTYRIPDVCVIPRPLVRHREEEFPEQLEVYEEPMPLVIEIWSPSTGETDRAEKLREYQQRGDLEIWHIQPYERTLTAWRRQPDGRYIETRYTGGLVQVASLPGVVIDLDTLFD